MADKDVIQTIVTALGNRVKALAEEAEKALQGGEAEYAKLKTAIGAELASLRNEITGLLEKV